MCRRVMIVTVSLSSNPQPHQYFVKTVSAPTMTLSNIELAENPFQILQRCAPPWSCSVASFLISCVGGREGITRGDRLVLNGAGAGRAQPERFALLLPDLSDQNSGFDVSHDARRPPLSPTSAFVCRCDAKARAGCGGVRGLPLLQAGHAEGSHRAHLHDRAKEGEKPTAASSFCPPTHWASRAAPFGPPGRHWGGSFTLDVQDSTSLFCCNAQNVTHFGVGCGLSQKLKRSNYEMSKN